MIPLAELVDKVKTGEAEAFPRLVEALRAAAESDLKALLDALRSTDAIMRRAAARVAPGRHDAAVAQALAALVHDPETAVRRTLAESLVALPAGGFDEIVGRLLD